MTGPHLVEVQPPPPLPPARDTRSAMRRLLDFVNRMLCRHRWQFAGFAAAPGIASVRLQVCMRCRASRALPREVL